MIERNILKSIILEQNEFKGSYIERDKITVLNKKASSPFIVIISGIRRCGKSTLLNLFREKQKEQNYYLNFDDERLHTFTLEDFESLYEIFVELYNRESIFYFDEIQNIKGWEMFVRRISDAGNKVYITGSNASMLSSELGTRLTGRYIQIELFPASFNEYLRYNSIKLEKNDFFKREKIAIIKRMFNLYITQGGFLQYLNTKDKDFFKLLYDNIIYRDIVARYSLSHEKGLKDIIYYLISNISKEFSYTSLKNISNIASITTIKDYISYLENSYLIFSLNRFDYSLKKQLINPKKIYVIDNGFANSVSFKFSEDKGRLLENLVFIDLKRQGKEIYYHKNKFECDFLIFDRGEVIEAIQVTSSLYDENAKKREVRGLIDAMKSYKLKQGLILTEDEEYEFEEEGYKITVMPIWKWLLN